MTPHDRAVSCNSLICLLQALEGRTTTVELRNESTITGKIESVDSYMNITLLDAILHSPKGVQTALDNFFIHGRQIRYVHIPDDVDVAAALRKQLQTFNSGPLQSAASSQMNFGGQQSHSADKWYRYKLGTN